MRGRARDLALIILLGPSAALSMLGTADAQEVETEPKGFDWDHLECTAVDEKLTFPSYWAGPSFDGLELTSVIRACDGPPRGEPAGWNRVTFVYGDCDASRGGCAPPIQIQTTPYELRNRELLAITGTATHVEGVPATRYGGTQLEIYHPGVTVVIFGWERGRVDRFAKALVEGPPVLADLASFGIDFESDCVSDIHYCQGDRLGNEEGFLGHIAIAVLLFLIGPLLAFAFRPRREPVKPMPEKESGEPTANKTV